MRIIIEEGLTQAERAFNVLGCVPVAAIVSGSIRMLVGKVQFVAAAAIALVGLAHYLSNGSCQWGEAGVEHMVHGALNFGRGLTEMLLGITLVGSPLLLIGQLFTEQRFHPQFQYTTVRMLKVQAL